jgi:lipopolysaccharide/colanic/teichoic acid biosynthesis glycosyltransferase
MPESRFLPVGLVWTSEHKPEFRLEDCPIYSDVVTLRQIADEVNVGCVILAPGHNRSEDLLKQLVRCQLDGLDLLDGVEVHEVLTQRISAAHVSDYWSLFVSLGRVRPVGRVVKRTVDVVGATLLLVLSAPVMVLAAIAIRRTSPGPIFYRQTRLGQDGVPFSMMKFRTMVPDAEAKAGPMMSPRNDPRITAVGAILRRTRLDEMPQFLNVLRGEMSLVGPRPERDVFASEFSSRVPVVQRGRRSDDPAGTVVVAGWRETVHLYSLRLLVKPGLTGWAQVKYPYASTLEENRAKAEYDLYYIKNQSFLLDLSILLRTIGVVLWPNLEAKRSTMKGAGRKVRGNRAAVARRLLLGLGIVFGCAATAAESADGKKLVYYGWSSPDTEYVRKNWRTIEKLPFHGMGVVVALDREAWSEGERSARNQLGWNVMGSRQFRVEEFQEAIADLRSPRWQGDREDFLPVILSFGKAGRSADRLDWFDDARWKVIEANFGVVAAIAKAAGMRGMLLDPEEYGYALFSYATQRQRIPRPFGDHVAAARARGRQIMRAVSAQLDRPVLLSLFGNSLAFQQVRGARRLEEAQYGLLPAFYDGILDAMPAGGLLVDGFELSYGFKRRSQFERARLEIRHLGRTLSATPAQYDQHVRVGFGLMLDFRDDPQYRSPQELRRSLTDALDVSDAYVWLYSQRSGFFPVQGISGAHLDAICRAAHDACR